MQNEEMYQLLVKMKDGDQQAFQTMYDATYRDVYRTVSFLVDHQQDREDVMNEIYMQMWTSLANYDTNRSFHFWLHGLVIRQVQRFRVKSWRRFRIFERIRIFSREEHHWDEPTLIMKGTNQEISQAIQKLTDKQRTVIIFRFFHDYTLEEIATLLDIPLGTVKSRYHAGLQALRKNIGNLLPERMGKTNAYGTQNP
ncbi:sigma-70 family RNA polymerase sigma factor [Paenibacillus oleatilyticus]|uniref:sigma-70 family RNA polymerase sigma factor n=1 Tax=Paenibacillus oleatilyticus TaxID=2594886 RepID=UPI001C200FC4|nr:sigma-70 family RNA polymerase sigma factor [Paenibacillus oleatilyticus]MBU7316586.1 sigma-70 family RNA polymerase sigma factor [Paenibacillus oleatilyticus]